jgi:MFS superfamily sulfate permease-like transporter
MAPTNRTYGSLEDSPKQHQPIPRHSSLLDPSLSPSPTPEVAFASPLLRRFSPSPKEAADTYITKGGDDSHPSIQTPFLDQDNDDTKQQSVPIASVRSSNESFIYYIVYALVNSIMCVPCLYGYASVIFSHPIYQSHINALSKLVILSSVVHQFCFSIFSSLPFSIGQVQDAGLIFLSAMSHKIATSMLEGRDANDEEVASEIVSTTIVLLGLSTACLGAVLVVMGKFRLADAVAYLPLPVVGGYLAFIGYFCLEAGVALCISHTIMKPSDWSYLFDEKSLLLATPGIIAGIFLTLVSRKCVNEAILPISMVAVPLCFYGIMFFCGYTISDARESGWVGQSSPSVPASDLLRLVDFNNIRWDLGKELISTWAGMVFVVSFSSCLDVAAISMDMGEALDTNNELMTVGISNFVSGLAGGFTGSYIFSQTIFTYRTNCRSRWIGIIVAFTFILVVISPVNFLEVTPLFFLGSTLIFIGFDLLFEWIIEVRHKLLLSEYLVLLATFLAVQFLGINAGIFLGIIVAIIDFVLTTANVSTVARVSRRSLAMWRPQERGILETTAYNSDRAQILTLEVRGAIFFGSAMKALTNILDEAGINASLEEKKEIIMVNSPLPHHSRINNVGHSPSLSPASFRERREQRKEGSPKFNAARNLTAQRVPPRFLVLDLSSVTNVDASAARGCFLQLAKMCSNRNVVVCAAGANSHITWLLKTHETAHDFCLHGSEEGHSQVDKEKIILFNDLNEALYFCEATLLAEASSRKLNKNLDRGQVVRDDRNLTISLSTVFTDFLGLDEKSTSALAEYERRGKLFHTETVYTAGQTIFKPGTNADGFYVVLSGTVAVLLEDRFGGDKQTIVSGAGVQTLQRPNMNVLQPGQISRVLSVGSVFGFVDYILQRPRSFQTVGAKNALVAKISRKGLEEVKKENPELERIVDKVLLLCSVVELAAGQNSW